MKVKHQIVSIVFCLFLVLSGCAHGPGSMAPGALYQVSTINALLEGAYDGEISCGDLLKQGDFGLGTFDGLNGEMVVVDGKIYRVAVDGKASEVPPDETSPLACVSFFRPDRSLQVDRPLTLKELEKYLDETIPTQNIFYAVKLEGTFKYVKTRSVPRQSKPYIRLVEVAAKQPIFEFRDVKGTVVGFRSPEYVQGVNVPGYHFHFITADRKGGGHIIDLQIGQVKAEIDDIHELRVSLPRGGDFYKLDLRGREGELHKVEK